MIRHGQASFGKADYDRLSLLGIDQARILGEHLVGTGIVPDAIYSGTMTRQMQTAQVVIDAYVAEGAALPEVSVVPGLNEFDSDAIVSSVLPDMMDDDPLLADDLEKMYRQKDSFKRIFEGAMLRWISEVGGRPGIETWEGFVARVKGVIENIRSENGRNKTVFAFTSGGPVAGALKHVLAIPDETAIRLNWQIVNSSYTSFMYNSQRITLSGFNSTAHLMLHGRGSLITYR